MTPYNTDIRKVIKWLQNEAPNIQALITKKAEWYDQYNEKFWSDWQKNVFDINQCNAFGLCIWCAILGIPSELFDLSPSYLAFAFGDDRENFIADASNTHTNPNTTGGNFAGANGAVTDLEEIRIMVKLRYATLVSNGRVIYINRMLRYILNGGEPWMLSSGKYAYVIDAAYSPSASDVDVWKVTDWQYPEGRAIYPQGSNVSKITDSESVNPDPSFFVYGKVTYIPGLFTADPNTTLAPDGISQATILRIAGNTATTSRAVSIVDVDTVNIPDIKSYGLTFFVKNILNQRYIFVRASLYVPTNIAFGNIRIDLQSETITALGGTTFNVATLKRLSNGWYKVVINQSFINFATTPITGATLDINIVASDSQWSNNMPAAAIPSDGDYSAIPGLSIWGVNLFTYAEDEQKRIPPYFTSTAAAGYNYTGETSDVLEHKMTILDEKAYYPNSTKVTWHGVADGVSYTTEQSTVVSDSPPYKSFTPNVSFIGPVSNEYAMEYRFGPELGLSSTFITLLNDRDNQLLPNLAGVPYSIIQEV